MDDFQTYYQILELAESATKDDIRAAWARLVREYHTDGIPEDRTKLREEITGRLQQINEAYRILSKPDTRRQYDEQLRQLHERARRSSATSHSNHPPPQPPRPKPPPAPSQRTHSTPPQPRSPPPPTAPPSVAPSRSVWGVCAVMLIIAALGYGGWSKSKIPSPAPAATPSSASPTSVSFGGKTLEVKLEPNQVYNVDDVRAGQSWRYLSFNGAFSHRVDKGDGQACWKLVENNLPWSADWPGKLQVKAGDSAVKFTVNIR